MTRRGRPRVQINWEEFDKLCAMWCTLEEIASYFNCSADTIERAVKRSFKTNFAEHYAQKAANGRIALRRRQLQTALAGNVTMQIWLGKQKLGQTDKITTVNETSLEAKVSFDRDELKACIDELESEV